MLKNDRNIHTRRADVLWKKYQSEKEHNKFKCCHTKCCEYSKWKTRHPRAHKKLVHEADNTVLAIFENIQTVLHVDDAEIEVKGTIRSQVPPCLGSASAKGPHPYTCKNCNQHFNYLKMKLDKKKHASYSLKENRFGKRGMCHKYLTVSEMRNVTNTCIKESTELKKAFKKVSLTRNQTSWTTRLMEACDRDEEERFMNDLSLAFQSEKLNVNSIHFKLMSNLVDKLMKRRNHKYSDIIINIGRLLCNQVGRTGYQTWESMLGLSSDTTLDRRRKHRKITPGLMLSTFSMATECYTKGHPLVATHDEARSLRMLEVMKHPDCEDSPIFIGDSWPADCAKWPKAEQLTIPRQDTSQGDPDDYTAVERFVGQKIKNLASQVAIHNLYCPTSDKMSPMPFMTIPLQARGYRAVHTLALWQMTRRHCYYDTEGCIRSEAVPICFWSSDAASSSLSAGKFIMTPNQELIEKGVSYIGLNLPDEKYRTPYFWKYPSVYFPDPDHLLRLFLRSLKYDTRSLTFYSNGNINYMATIGHLEKLRNTTCNNVVINLSLQDLILIKYHDQNTNAAEKVFSEDMCDKLSENIKESNGTVLYIKAVCLLMKPCRESQLTYQESMMSVAAGIYIIRLWKRHLEITKKRLHSGVNTSQDPSRRGNFVTMACYDCAELLYSGVVGYLLTLYLHFPELLHSYKSPINISTRTTERMISEIQGQTTHNQHLDKQPTYAAMLHRMRGVEENQQILEELKAMGVRERVSNNRREVLKTFQVDEGEEKDQEPLPQSLTAFIEELTNCHNKGVAMAKEIIQMLLPEDFINSLKAESGTGDKSAWEMPYTFAHPVTVLQNKEHPFIDIDFHTLGSEVIELSEQNQPEDVEHAVADDTEIYNEMRDNEEEDATNSEIEPGLGDDCGTEEKQSDRSKWYFSKLENGKLENYHIQKILMSIIPREYISRERRKRHIAGVHLPGMQPIPKTDDIVQFHDYVYKDYKNVVHIVNIARIESCSGMTQKSCQSKENCRFIGKLYDYIDGGVSDTICFTKWIGVQSIITEVEIEKFGDTHRISQSSQDQLEQLGVTFGSLGVYILKKKKRSKKQELPDDFYEIDIVKRVRYNKNYHHYECLIKFKEYDESHDVWLPESSLKSPITIKLERGSGGRMTTLTLGGKDAEATAAIVQDEPVRIDGASGSPVPACRESRKRKNESGDLQHEQPKEVKQCHIPLQRCKTVNPKPKENQLQATSDNGWPSHLKNIAFGRSPSLAKSIFVKKIEIDVQSWLGLVQSHRQIDDSVIDAYMEILCQETPGAFVLQSQLISFWQEGKKCQWKSLGEADFTKYRLVLMPMIQYHHWTLMAADMSTKSLSVYNSIGPDEKLTCVYFEYWRQFLKCRGTTDDEIKKWKSENGVSGKQTDSVSCGVFVMMKQIRSRMEGMMES